MIILIKNKKVLLIAISVVIVVTIVAVLLIIGLNKDKKPEAEEKIDVSAIEDAGLAADAITLEEDEYFVLGDNRNNSEDSRYANIGNIKREYLVGKAWFVLTTGDRFGFIR